MFQKSSSTLTICGVMLFQPLILRGSLTDSSLASVSVKLWISLVWFVLGHFYEV